MKAPRYKIYLLAEEREALEEMTRTDKTSSREFKYARALLLCDAGAGAAWKVADVAEALGVSSRTIEHVKARFSEGGLEAVMVPRKAPVRPSRLIYDAAFDARLTALACSPAPSGRARWTVRLLAQKIVELQVAPTATRSAVHRSLKKRAGSASQPVLEDPAAAQRRVRRRHGGGA